MYVTGVRFGNSRLPRDAGVTTNTTTTTTVTTATTAAAAVSVVAAVTLH